MIARNRHRKTVVVIGNGMVGHRFCERLVEYDVDRAYQIVTFCEEPRPAYDRVNLSKYFERRDAEHLKLACPTWYADKEITLHIGERATAIDRENRLVISSTGREIDYDAVVLATGSAPFVPTVPGVDKKGVFVYRTIEDLEKIIAYAGKAASAAVIGGGLLGLEAAKAVRELGLETHVVEFAPRLMPRQVDDAGARTLLEKIEGMNVRVHLGKTTQEFLGNGKVAGPGVRRRRAARGRHGRHLGGHPAARRAGPRLRPGGRPARRGRRRRRPADLRPGHLRHRRGRRAPGHGLRPGRARVRDGRGRGGEPRRVDRGPSPASTCRPS